MYILAAFLTVWIGFAIFGFSKKWSGIISVASGFLVSCCALVVYGTLLIGPTESDAKEANPSPVSQRMTSSASASSQVNSLTSKLVGDWYCRNEYNYISKDVYTSDGKYLNYDTGYAANVRSDNLPLSYIGSYSLDGDILRVTTRSVSSSGSEFSYAVKITTLDNKNLVKYWQDSNYYERCFKPFD